MGRSLVELDRADESNLGVYTTACILAGTIEGRSGDKEAARRHWQTALQTLESLTSESNHWRLLDPAARALALLGRVDESRAIVMRLQRFGYQPLEPWP